MISKMVEYSFDRTHEQEERLIDQGEGRLFGFNGYLEEPKGWDYEF